LLHKLGACFMGFGCFVVSGLGWEAKDA